MKKLLLLTALLCSYTSFSQTNTLPSSGNVGIGTTNPNQKLHVRGNVKIDSTLVVKDSVVVDKTLRVKDKLTVDQNTVLKKDVLIKQDLTVKGLSEFDSTVTYDGKVKMNALEYPNNFNNKSFLLLSNNNVVQRADLDSIAPVLKMLVYGPELVPGQPLGICDLAGYLNNPTWKNGLNKIFSPCPEVFVGIGTSTPKVSLDVRGDMYGWSMRLGDVDPTISHIQYHQNYHPSDANDKSTIFLVENGERRLFQITNDGIVRSREVIVNLQNNWPDYVFKPSYELMPLSDVETYINENGHLPNIPAAKTVEENGIELGEMNRILLEKIEELTLHQIELEKRIKELENK